MNEETFTLGSEVDLLEKEYAHISGTKHAVSVGSGTDAIFLSLKALGVGNGDEVITTTFTFMRLLVQSLRRELSQYFVISDRTIILIPMKLNLK